MPNERPILFSGPMVRAILEGRKTVTRRICKPQPSAHAHTTSAEGNPMSAWWETGKDINHCPYGQPGERLWVRETWARVGTTDPGYLTYRATYPRCLPAGLENVPADIRDAGERWRPSIHMPRTACRILLEITAVHVERLQDITEEQAVAEGVDRPENIRDVDVSDGAERELFNAMNQPRDRFKRLWADINGAESWNANPWVWVVEFKRVTP